MRAETQALVSLDADGFAIVSGVLDDATVQALIDALDRAGAAHGHRDLARDVPAVRDAAALPSVRALVDPSARLVRSLLFDKTEEANWKVAWHQDLAVAVRERRDVPGFSAWSVKNGVPHALAPASVLERILAVRLHLDDCASWNGPVRVLPGSHRHGRIDGAAIAGWRTRAEPVPCPVPRGGALVMRPLLVHASSPAAAPRRRRVVHLEYAVGGLPGGLEWSAC